MPSATKAQHAYNDACHASSERAKRAAVELPVTQNGDAGSAVVLRETGESDSEEYREIQRPVWRIDRRPVKLEHDGGRG
jgi:hypothetical protein